MADTHWFTIEENSGRVLIKSTSQTPTTTIEFWLSDDQAFELTMDLLKTIDSLLSDNQRALLKSRIDGL